MDFLENAKGTGAYIFLQQISKEYLSDGVVEDAEVAHLINWIQQEGRHRKWPFNVLYQRIMDALEDGIIDDEERKELEDILIELSGASSFEQVYELTESVPFNLEASIEFLNKEFVFTGKFAYGSRKKCQQAVVERGGTSPNNVRSSKTDYIVVGCGGSPDYNFGAFGNKVIHALEMQDSDDWVAPLNIIPEELWYNALSSAKVLNEAESLAIRAAYKGILWRSGKSLDRKLLKFLYSDGLAENFRELDLYEVRRTKNGDIAFTGICRLRNAERTFMASKIVSSIDYSGDGYTPEEFARYIVTQ